MGEAHFSFHHNESDGICSSFLVEAFRPHCEVRFFSYIHDFEKISHFWVKNKNKLSLHDLFLNQSYSKTDIKRIISKHWHFFVGKSPVPSGD